MTKISTTTGDLTIRGLTAETWNAFAALAEKHNGVWAGDLIAQVGGGVVGAYPRDTKSKKLSASHLYNGTRGQFEKAGFEFVRSKGEFNCVMRITIGPA
jgi:hypothetical protein